MSMDYEFYLQGLKAEFEQQAKVFTGAAVEKKLDQSYRSISDIPVLLNSEISIDMRALVLSQYTEIQGGNRDAMLGELTRDAFYDLAAQHAEKEAVLADANRSSSSAYFKDLQEYLGDEVGPLIEAIEEEHKNFKGQLPNVIKSKLGIPVDEVVGVGEVVDYQKLITFD